MGCGKRLSLVLNMLQMKCLLDEETVPPELTGAI